jgi:hypothetical protein
MIYGLFFPLSFRWMISHNFICCWKIVLLQ